jgi:putative ABC transport system permease protein
MTATAVTALALGIGANTALFSVINAVLLRPLSYPHPERIAALMRQYPGGDIWATTATKFAFWRDQNQSFEAVAAHSFMPIGLNLVGRGEPQRLAGLATTADYFRVFGVRPQIGRSYTAEEDRPGAGKFAVLSFSLWQSLFHGDPGALGRVVSLSNESYQVIGVMPQGFESPQHADLWVPMQLKIDPSDVSNNYPVIGRLKPGASLEMAQADMKVVGERFRKTYGSDKMGTRESIAVAKYRDYLVGDSKRPLWILLAAVGFVLLIACANVANLLLARSAARQREMAVRIAIGASGGQIIRQLLTESLVLSMAGAAGGCLLAGLFLPLLLGLAPADIPRLGGAAIDWKVLLYTLAVASSTGTLFGLFPALQSARLGTGNPLREGTRTTSAASRRVRQGLVVSEIAITLLLLAGASLLIRTLKNLGSVEPGFDAKDVLTTQMSLSDKYANPRALAQLNTRVAARLESVSGVKSVATAGLLPLTPYMDLPFEIVGRAEKRDAVRDELYRFVSPRYFSTLRIPVIDGREFAETDSAASEPVIIINKALAAKHFPKQDPLGQQMLVGRGIGPIFADKPRRIVGVVGNTRDAGLGQPDPPVMFVPEAQVGEALLKLDMSALPLNWIIRTSGNPMALAERIRREALTVAGDVPLAEPRPLEGIISNSLARQRFVMTLLIAFASLALLLGTVGLYGVVSYSVAQRTRELGIRSALGAGRTDLVHLVLGEGMRLAGVGLAIGLLAIFGLTRFLESLLYGVSPSDPVVVGGVTFLMGAVTLAACGLPAYRASRVEPLIALHEE